MPLNPKDQTSVRYGSRLISKMLSGPSSGLTRSLRINLSKIFTCGKCSVQTDADATTSEHSEVVLPTAEVEKFRAKLPEARRLGADARVSRTSRTIGGPTHPGPSCRCECSADPNIEYLSDGITEYHQPVVSTVSMRSWPAAPSSLQADPRERWRRLGAQTVLPGGATVRRSLIVRTELVDAVNGWHCGAGNMGVVHQTF